MRDISPRFLDSSGFVCSVRPALGAATPIGVGVPGTGGQQWRWRPATGGGVRRSEVNGTSVLTTGVERFHRLGWLTNLQ